MKNKNMYIRSTCASHPTKSNTVSWEILVFMSKINLSVQGFRRVIK
jgi:hypothetical protein